MMLENFILVPCGTNVKPFVALIGPWRTLVPVITMDDVVKPYLHLPSSIQTALMRVETHPVFRTLTKSTLLVLKTLVSRASARNGTAIIRARIDRMAAEAGVSEKTTQRALRCFRDREWVMPASEGRSEWGVFESRRYIFTQNLCDLIELPTKDSTAVAPPVQTQPIKLPTKDNLAITPLAQTRLIELSTKDNPAVAPLTQTQINEFPTKASLAVVPPGQTQMSDGAIYVDLSYKKDLREISIKNREGQPPTLPLAVCNIPNETGILATGVCKLLGIARQVGYQLEHVYAVAKPYLAKIGVSPARTFRYMQTMLLNPKKIDYAAKAAQKARQFEISHDPGLATIAKQVRYKRYVHKSNGMQVRFFDGIAEVRRDGHFEVYAGAQMQGLYKGVANGNLVVVLE